MLLTTFSDQLYKTTPTNWGTHVDRSDSTTQLTYSNRSGPTGNTAFTTVSIGSSVNIEPSTRGPVFSHDAYRMIEAERKRYWDEMERGRLVAVAKRVVGVRYWGESEEQPPEIRLFQKRPPRNRGKRSRKRWKAKVKQQCRELIGVRVWT